MIIKIFFLVQLFLAVNAKLCDEKNSVDLSDEHALQDGTFVKNGVRFTTDYVYTKNVSGEVKSYGCLCEFQKCFRKCCPLGNVFLRDRNGTKSCIERYDVLQVEGLNVSFMDSFKRTIHLEDDEFSLIYGVPCDGDVFLERNIWAVQEDGSLYTEMKHSIPPWMIKSQDKYCVDTFVVEDEDGTQKTTLDALVCFAKTEEQQHYLLSASCMLISCVFILATVGVYGWLPELRNLHGRVLMTYLMCLFVAFAFLITMQILLLVNNISKTCCAGLTIVIYFSLQSAFFWLNVMCFDIWWTFSGKRGITIEKLSLRAKFCAYAIYAFGIPTLLTVILVSLEFSGLPPHPFLPMIRRQGCFLYGKSRLFYLYGPIMVLCFANLLFFILTAVKITQIKRQTSVLKSRESATHDRQNNERQRLLLYVKLFIVMGINWLLEVISSLYPEADNFWRFTDAYNVLIGLIIFILFVCKRKIFRLMKKRYKQARGDSISKSQNSTRTFCSIRDEMGLTSRIDKIN